MIIAVPRPTKETVQLCPVTLVDIITKTASISVETDYTTPYDNTIVKATLQATANLRLRRTPRAAIARIRGGMTQKSANRELVVSSVDITDSARTGNPIEQISDQVLSDVLFQQLGENCLKCTLSERCTLRGELAAIAHDPTRAHVQS
jgi:hypothetical protein